MENKTETSSGKKKILPPAYLLISIVIILLLFLFLPVKTIIPFPYNLIGLLPLIFGIAINLIADKTFKEKNTTVKPFEQSTALITTGVFRISRHPMYLGFVCILLGIAMLTKCISTFVVPIVFAVLMDRIFIRQEEQMLQGQFGNDWQEYKNKTRRWI